MSIKSIDLIEPTLGMRLGAYNKSSAVAELWATIWPQYKHAEKLCPFQWGGELSSYLTQCRLGRGLPPYQRHQVAS